MPLRSGLGGLRVLAEAQHDAALAGVDDVEAARQPDDDDQRDEDQGAAAELPAAGAAGLTPAALAARQPGSLCRKRFHSSSRSGGPSFPRRPQLRVVQCHECCASVMFGCRAAGRRAAVEAGYATHAVGRIRTGSSRTGTRRWPGARDPFRRPSSALTRRREILPYSSRSKPAGSAVRSVLLSTSTCGTSPAPISVSTRFTSAICASCSCAGAIHHVQQQVGLHRLLERGAERRHQRGGQVADEADRVGQHHFAAHRAYAACAWWCRAWRTAGPRRRRRPASAH